MQDSTAELCTLTPWSELHEVSVDLLFRRAAQVKKPATDAVPAAAAFAVPAAAAVAVAVAAADMPAAAAVAVAVAATDMPVAAAVAVAADVPMPVAQAVAVPAGAKMPVARAMAVAITSSATGLPSIPGKLHDHIAHRKMLTITRPHAVAKQRKVIEKLHLNPPVKPTYKQSAHAASKQPHTGQSVTSCSYRGVSSVRDSWERFVIRCRQLHVYSFEGHGAGGWRPYLLTARPHT